VTLPWVALITTGSELETPEVLIEKVALVAPATTVTLDCTVALVLLVDKLTPTPPTAAGPLNVTVPTDFLPPRTDDGESVTLNSDGGVIERAAVFVTVPKLLEIVADFELCRARVVTAKVADEEPDATVTVLGTAALELLDDKLTTNPPAGAGPLNVTVPVLVLPPVTVVGDKDID
jgi:hypothetical protein